MAALLLAVFGGIGMLLAVVGIWGIVSYAVARRTREVGLRMALGSSPREAVLLLTTSGARLVGIGAGIGLVLALATSRLVQGYLFGIGALEIVTFAAVPLLLGTIGVLAAWLPARRAASVDPMCALRVE
jgi:ABC-type antimicrobial peptide transport system permease subunit